MNWKTKKTKPEKEDKLPFKGHKTRKHFLAEVKEKEKEKELRDSIRQLQDVHL